MYIVDGLIIYITINFLTIIRHIYSLEQIEEKIFFNKDLLNFLNSSNFLKKNIITIIVVYKVLKIFLIIMLLRYFIYIVFNNLK